MTLTDPAFATARLSFEPLGPAHAAEFHAALDHPDVWRFITGPDATTVSGKRARLERLARGSPRPDERWWNFAVRLSADRTSSSAPAPVPMAPAAGTQSSWLPAPDAPGLAAPGTHAAGALPAPDPSALGARSAGPLVGHIQATTYDTWGEIAYLFGPRWWGQGLASEATRWLIGHLAAHHIDELWAAVHPANERSRRLLARTGFTAVERPVRPLSSFDPGDAVFVRYA